MLSVKTHKNQSNLSRYCRTGEYIKIDGVNEKHVGQYRRLVFNNVYDSISSVFPLTNDLLGEEAFENLVNRFFSSHNIQSPQIWYMPIEFKDFVIEYEYELIEEYPFLQDLLEVEWLEVEVFMMPDIPLIQPSVSGKYYINPEIRIIKLDYPVHLKKSGEISEKDKGLYFLALHRNRDSGAVHFTNLSIPFVDVLEHLLQNCLSEKEIIDILKKYVEDKIVNDVFLTFIQKSIYNQLIFKS